MCFLMYTVHEVGTGTSVQAHKLSYDLFINRYLFIKILVGGGGGGGMEYSCEHNKLRL